MNYHDTEDHDNLPDEVASDLAGPLDDGANSAATMLQAGSCHEHFADNIGSVAEQEGDQWHVP